MGTASNRRIWTPPASPSEADGEGEGFRLQSYLRPLKRSAERSGP
jgi:hypothetical protein